MTVNLHKFDLLVVGAGLVGSSFVLALQQQGLRIALLDQQWVDPSAQGGRPISLAAGSVAIFRTLGVWEALAAHATPITQVDVSEQGVLGAVHFRAADYAVEALGYVVPFQMLAASLQHAARQQAGVESFQVAELLGLGEDEHGRWLAWSSPDGAQHRAQGALVVGADGAASRVRDLLAIDVQREQAAKVAVYGSLRLAQPQPGVALERFAQHEVLAVLPAALHSSGFVVTLPTDQWETRRAWSAAAWQQYCQQALGFRYGAVEEVRVLGSMPLATVIAQQSVQPGAVLLGNAAHTLYPLAAQGFNLGLRDAAALAEVLVAARQRGQALGALAVLQRYQRWRAEDQARVMRLTDSLARGFGWQVPGLRQVRGLALLAMDLVTPLKRRVARLAMGMTGQLPRLMRGLRLWGEELSDANHETR